jgi:thiamine pyridinylase
MRLSEEAAVAPGRLLSQGKLIRACAILAIALTSASSARAGELVVYNLSSRPVTCSVDGYTKASGADADTPFRVDPGQTLNLPPSFKAKDHAINTVECGGLRARALNLTPESPDRVLFLNGRQRRVLNALLYASIPTDPKTGFTPLIRWLAMSYQAAHPDVLLNLVIDPSIDVYSFGNLKDNVFSATGFDVAEIDTVFLKWLKDEGLISPARITGDEPWPVGKQAVTIDGQAYGVPSWLCSDFLFSTTGDMGNIKTFPDMQAYLAKIPGGRRGLVGDLDGTWTIPAFYLQAFVQSHADMTAVAAAAAPIDSAAIARLARFGTYCSLSNADPCIDGTFHAAKDGAVEQDFVAEQGGSDLGFSERSFFLAYYQSVPAALSLTPMPWGDQPDAPRLVYSDAFITSKTACSKDPCETDAAEFAAFMTSAPTKKYIAMATDLPGGDPPRHLLVATKPFYDDDDVKGDPVYSQLASGFLKGNIRPYLPSFTPKLQYDLLSGICPALKQQSPGWKCKVPKKPE